MGSKNETSIESKTVQTPSEYDATTIPGDGAEILGIVTAVLRSIR